MSDFKKDLNRSSKALLEIVWPEMSLELGGGELIPVETSAIESLAKYLDQKSGIDAWQVCRNDQIRGIASRVQFGDNCWSSFTVRYKRDSGAKTEYEKRRSAIHSKTNFIYPDITIQAYVGGSLLLGYGAIKTIDLIDACDTIIKEQEMSENAPTDKSSLLISGRGIRRTSNASFIYMDWGWLKKSGYKIICKNLTPA